LSTQRTIDAIFFVHAAENPLEDAFNAENVRAFSLNCFGFEIEADWTLFWVLLVFLVDVID
jgi:hypothetical protein